MPEEGKNLYDRVLRWSYAIDKSPMFSSIKKGFVLVIPIVMTGSFALLIRNFPIPVFHEWLLAFAGGLLDRLLSFVFDATAGFLSAYLVLGISYYYSEYYAQNNFSLRIMAMIASLSCFIASFGGASGSLELGSFGTIGVFTAMLCSIAATRLFFAVVTRRFFRFRSYAAGVDFHFRNSMTAILPMVFCVVLFAVFNLILEDGFGARNLNDLISGGLTRLFGNLREEPGNGVAFILSLNLLWFFGIHGGNALDTVAQTAFQGGVPGAEAVLSKSFLDHFAVIGGCGAALCLLLALLLSSLSKSNRRLGWSAAPMAFFNINEILVFGLPVVLNPVMLIPFILVPVLSLLIAYGAVTAGLMPPAVNQVTWTTPALFSGYLATGSFAGSLVQLVIIAAGTAVYLPFVRLSERLQNDSNGFVLEELTERFRKEEAAGAHEALLLRQGRLGAVAKAMAYQLRADIQRGEVPLFYQPQVDQNSQMPGVEALLRWRYLGHPVYPPLTVALAQEDGCFEELTWLLLSTACGDLSKLDAELSSPVHISVNVVASQLNDRYWIERVIQLAKVTGANDRLVLEVTEESSLEAFPCIGEHIDLLSKNGIFMAIDDFSMGKTSLNYLRDNQFRFVKLDGSLVKQLPGNPRCREIVGSIISLGNHLGFSVIAEWVETLDLRDRLLELGCTLYQGYLYSPAVPLEELIGFAKALKPDITP